MSYTFTFTGKTSTLTASFNPPIFLDPNDDYVLGLISFETFNSIPNVTSANNQVKVGTKLLQLPEGSYEVSNIADYINSQIGDNKVRYVRLYPNRNTLRTIIKATVDIDFDVPNSIGPLLGFKKKRQGEDALVANVRHESDEPIDIITTNSLIIDCSITLGSYKNGEPSHILHQFFPSVPPGFKIIECPDHVIYLPINVKAISTITLKILDQDDHLVNFRNETITIGLHLKSLRNGISV